MFRFRALPLLVVAVGVVASRRPISSEQQRRICADLCRSGLGGEPCGAVCFDLMPSGIPLQSRNATAEAAVSVTNTRSAACPVLCENHLGYPLCQCDLVPQASSFTVDFHQICDYYCQHQRWALRGCPVCSTATARQDGLHKLFKQDGAMITKMVNIPGVGTSFQAAAGRKVDWGKWCEDQCAQNNGGSACNCDILPFSLH